MSLDKWIGVVALMGKVGALATSWAWLLVITSFIHCFVSIDCPRIHMKAHAFPLELMPSCMWRVDIGWVMNPREYGRRLAYVEATLSLELDQEFDFDLTCHLSLHGGNSIQVSLAWFLYIQRCFALSYSWRICASTLWRNL